MRGEPSSPAQFRAPRAIEAHPAHGTLRARGPACPRPSCALATPSSMVSSILGLKPTGVELLLYPTADESRARRATRRCMRCQVARRASRARRIHLASVVRTHRSAWPTRACWDDITARSEPANPLTVRARERLGTPDETGHPRACFAARPAARLRTSSPRAGLPRRDEPLRRA